MDPKDINDLIQQAEDAGLEAADFEEAVCEGKEREAAKINAAGLEDQIAFLATLLTKEQLGQVIQQLVKDKKSGSAGIGGIAELLVDDET